MIEGDVNENYDLCEGIWFDKKQRTLIDKEDGKKQSLDINKIDDKIDDKILILKREIESWLFHPMIKLVEDDINNKSKYHPFKNAIFVLYGIFSYIEKIQRYKDGKPYKSKDTESTKILTFGFKKIFKPDEGTEFGNGKIESILESTRHSMMHSGNVGDKTLLNYDYENAVPVIYIGSNKDLRKIELNPISMLKEIVGDFDEYIKSLNDASKTDLRDNFEKVFNAVYSDEITQLS
ncbi:MAG: hypothetical protein U9N49_12240 [Campylobacterota bacterium]|nr:hypothetical protein [Campylobacterota bacterium]